MNFKSIVI